MDQKAPFSELKSNFCARESTSITVMFLSESTKWC